VTRRCKASLRLILPDAPPQPTRHKPAAAHTSTINDTTPNNKHHSMILICSYVQARLVCDRPKHDAPPQAGRPYLLHGLRLAVHFRRGDIAENKRWADRMLSTDYFINVVRQIMQVSCCGVV
jgi:hypothetical protein